MTQVRLRAEKAELADVPQIQRLVNYFADRGEMLHRSLPELYENLRDYVVVRDGGEVVAAGALHIMGADLAEIKAMAVREDQQGRGLGRLVVDALVDEAVALGLPRVYCLTYKPAIFARYGFRTAHISAVPQKLWGECYRCKKFPDCGEVTMVRDLPGRAPDGSQR